MPAAINPALASPARPRKRMLGAVLSRLGALVGRDPFAIAGIIIYLLFVLIAAFADQIATHDPLQILFQANGRLARNLKPDAVYLLGTTHLGNDIFSQLVYGTRAALIVGVTAAVVVVA